MSKSTFTPSHDPAVENLRNAVNVIDSLAQGGFSEIASIAKLALYSLETPEGCRHLGNIANALTVIWGKADEIQTCIGSEAAAVGCSYTNDRQNRRLAALNQVHKDYMRGAQ